MKDSILFQEKDIQSNLAQCQRAKQSASVTWAKSAILDQDLIWLTINRVHSCTFLIQSIFHMHRSVLAVWDLLCQHLFYKLVVSRICNLKIHPGSMLA